MHVIMMDIIRVHHRTGRIKAGSLNSAACLLECSIQASADTEQFRLLDIIDGRHAILWISMRVQISGSHSLILDVNLCMQIAAYACTDFTIIEDSGESTLDPSHRLMHDATAELVQSIVREQGFRIDL